MNKKGQIVCAFAFGCVFVLALLFLALSVPNPTAFQYQTFRIVTALAAAGVAAVIPGFLKIDFHPTAKALIRAGGALAVFIIVYFFNPAKLVTHASVTQTMVNSPGGMQAARDIIINSSIESEHRGILTPGNGPDPSPMPVDVPTSGVKVFLGSVRSISTAMDAEHIVIAVKTNHLGWFKRTHDGLYFSADIFRGDGRNVAKIRDNRWEVNPNNYFQLTNTRHELVVTDKEGLALRCRYLNESAVQIEGRFQFPDFPTIVITTNQVLVGGSPYIHGGIIGINNQIDLVLH